jgi:hypothetical protein
MRSRSSKKRSKTQIFQDLILPLTPENVSAPTPVELDTVAARMLWPDDSAARWRAIETSSIEFLRTQPDRLLKEDIVSLFSRAFDAKPLRELHLEVRLPFIAGARAGMYLQQTIGLISLGKSPAMKQLAFMVSAEIGPEGSAIQAKTFLNHIWPLYRSVSHFWAASLTLGFEKLGNCVFPCAIEEFRDFLALAEGHREKGEGMRTRQAPTTLLRPGKAVRLPAWFTERIEPTFQYKE